MPEGSSTGIAIHGAFRRWGRWSFGSNNRMNQYWLDQLNKDPTLSHVVYCLELVFGGDRIVRVSERDIKTTSGRDGRVFVWQGCALSTPSVEESVSFGSASSAARSFSFEIPYSLLNAVEQSQRGRILAGFGELSMQVDGMDYDDRYVIMRGDMDDGITFSPGEGGVITFSLTDPKEVVDLSMPMWTLDEDRAYPLLESPTVPGNYTSLSDNGAGERYPIVYNQYIVPAVPVVGTNSILYTAMFLVAYGHGHTVNEVYVNGSTVISVGIEFGYEVEEVFDNYGVPITVIRVSNGNYNFGDSETIHVDLTAGFPSFTNVLDIVQHSLRSFTSLGEFGINSELLGLARAKMGPSTIKALINGSGESDATKALSWIEDELLASFPMLSMVWTGGGIGPVVFDRRSSLIRAEFTAEQFPLKERISDVQESPKTSVYNNFTLRYKYSMLDDEYTGVVQRNAHNSDLCHISRDNCGELTLDPIDSLHIFDDIVAEYVIDWLVDHHSLPSYYVEYAAFAQVFLTYRVGDNVKITDSELGWTGEVATIERLEMEKPGFVIMGIRVWNLFYTIGAASRGYPLGA